MLRRFSGLVLLLIMVTLAGLPMRAGAAPTAAPAGPYLLTEVNGPGKGRVWVGAVPAGSSTKPVIVFVHGLHGKAQDWWAATTYSGTNDMYTLAFNNGFRTAFVSLDDETGGAASSVWTNGSTLNRQIDAIRTYYGVATVNIVAHSKGGADSNSAAVHYGAGPKIQQIVTLSSPHHGSQLANVAYSWWAWWLAALIGQTDAGTYSMQTSEMSYFRSVTDGRSENSYVRFSTAGGTNHGSLFSAMWWGGSYLDSYGSNDGVVTVSSSNHPRQYARLFTSDLNHDNIRLGNKVWSRIVGVAGTNWRVAGKPVAEEAASVVAKSSTATSERSNTIMRGGELTAAGTRVVLPVEGGVKHINFDLVATRTDLAVTFVAPNGKRYPATTTPADANEIFRGATHYAAAVDAPQSGQWAVEVSGANNAAYLLIASLDSALNVTVNVDQTVAAPSSRVNVAAEAQFNGARATNLELAGLFSGTAQGHELGRNLPTQQTLAARGQDRAATALDLPAQIGVYQLGLTITGIAPDGSAFERSVPTNIAVASPTSKGAALELPAGR